MVLQSTKVRLRGGQLQPFTLESGGKVVIAWRQPYPEQADDLNILLEALQKRVALKGLEVTVPFHVISHLPKPSSRTVRSLLSALDSSRMSEFCSRYGLDADRSENALAGTPRRLLALELARQSHQAICCVMTALDPLGVEQVRSYIDRELANLAVLEVMPPTYTPNAVQYPLGAIDVVPFSNVGRSA